MKTHVGIFVQVLLLVIGWQPADAGLDIRSESPSKRQMLHVLAIGSDYSSSWNPITGGSDAQALASVFKAGSGPLYGAAGVVEVVNDTATRDGILQAVNQAAAYLGPKDTFVFIFSGHVAGVEGQTYLVPHDAMSDASGPDTSKFITPAELQAALDRVGTRDRLLLFDSDYLDIQFRAKGTHVLQASGPGTSSQQGQQFGEFTAALLQALKGWGDANQDGRVSVFELAAFIGRELPALTSGRQFPVVRLYGPDFPLVVRPEQQFVPAVALADKLDANLVDLIRAHEAEGIDGVLAFGAEHRTEIPDGLVEVIINAVSKHALDRLEDEVVRLGGSVQTEFENVLYATLPVAALEEFVMQDAVRRLDWSRQVFAPPRDADLSRSR